MTLVRSMSMAMCCLLLAGCPDNGSGSSEEGSETGSDAIDDTSAEETGTEETEVFLNEIVADNPHGGDWIELYNGGDEDVCLSGWALVDSAPEHLQSLAGTLTIEAGGHLLLMRGVDFSFGIGAEDTVKLIGAGGVVADETSWLDGEAIEGTSWGRIPDGSGPFQAIGFPTPGSANTLEGEASCGYGSIEADEVCDSEQLSGEDCSDFGYMEGALSCADDCASFDMSECVLPDSDVMLNEVSSSELDFIELVNVSEDEVDVSGWMVMDGNPEAEGHVYTLPEESVLAAGEHLLLVKGEDHAFGLGNKDSVTLRNGSGFVVDTTSWSGGAAAISWCRIPDGAGPFASCEVATPGESNAE